MLVPLAGGGLGAYPSVRPVGTTTPTVATQMEIWDGTIQTRNPLSYVAKCMDRQMTDGGVATGSISLNPPISFALSYTADGGGAIAPTAFLASAGAGLKWIIDDIAVSAHPTATAPVITLSDSVGDLPPNVYCRWLRKQATLATGITLSASGLTALSRVVVVGNARKVT